MLYKGVSDHITLFLVVKEIIHQNIHFFQHRGTRLLAIHIMLQIGSSTGPMIWHVNRL